MSTGDAQLKWVVCHRATRSVWRLVVSCPLRGPVQGSACMGCRFLTTSSLERDDASWCDAPGSRPGLDARRPMPVRTVPEHPIPVEPAGREWVLSLPVLVAERAVRPPEPVPSGHRIGN